MFPTLKTGAAAQYPVGRSTRFSTQAVRFLDGSTQTFKLNGAGLRRWTIQLESLDEAELDAVISFVEATDGSVFSYIDPLTGATADQCRLAAESVDAVLNAQMTGRTALVIEEIA